MGARVRQCRDCLEWVVGYEHLCPMRCAHCRRKLTEWEQNVNDLVAKKLGPATQRLCRDCWQK